VGAFRAAISGEVIHPVAIAARAWRAGVRACSHPQALLQAATFLEAEHPGVGVHDTAGAARAVAEAWSSAAPRSQRRGGAALRPQRSSPRAPGPTTQSDALLDHRSRQAARPRRPRPDQGVSGVHRLTQARSLVAALQCLSERGINLTRSTRTDARPALQYSFYVDFEVTDPATATEPCEALAKGRPRSSCSEAIPRQANYRDFAVVRRQTHVKRKPNLFESKVFHVERIELDVWRKASCVVGEPLPLLPRARRAFPNRCHRLGLAGPAQAQNLKESPPARTCASLAASPGSESWRRAGAAGFSERDETLARCSTSSAPPTLYPPDLGCRAGSSLQEGVRGASTRSHARPVARFLLGYLETTARNSSNVNVIAVVSQGNGAVGAPSVRAGRDLNGGRINTSFAVEQDLEGRATDIRAGVVGCPRRAVHVQDDVESEVVSDLFGERSILLGAVHGIVEALYQRYLEAGAGPEEHFSRACESLTGPTRETISRHGLSHSTST